MISFIVAMDRKGTIGKDNRLPWHLPEDLAYFKDVTMGYPIIMGRKTFESIGRPLPGRHNVVLSRRSSFHPGNCTVLNSVEEALEFCRNREVFVIGGAEIFESLLPYADKSYVTLIEAEFEGDTFFPQINFDEWNLVSKIKGKKDEKNPYDFYFMVYERKK